LDEWWWDCGRSGAHGRHHLDHAADLVGGEVAVHGQGDGSVESPLRDLVVAFAMAKPVAVRRLEVAVSVEVQPK